METTTFTAPKNWVFYPNMISRRNIRVKVMQTLYAIETAPADDQENKLRAAATILTEKLNKSMDLFVVAILYTFRVAQFSETDATKRASKRLATDADKQVSIKIAGNEFMWQTLSNQTFVEKIKTPAIQHLISEDWVRKIYQTLIAAPEYEAYIQAPSRQAKEERHMMRFIWEHLILKNENLMEAFVDDMPGWEDDQDMVAMLMENFFKGSVKINFLALISDEKRAYAQALLKTVIDKKDYTMELVQPKLNNWDAERVALVDLLLLRIGICEFLYFPTIPTRVTINECIEIGKNYSTLQSGQFINGVLDNILKDLNRDNLIRKEARTGQA